MPLSAAPSEPANGPESRGGNALGELTAAALKALAKEKGIKGYGGMTKEQLIEVLSVSEEE